MCMCEGVRMKLFECVTKRARSILVFATNEEQANHIANIHAGNLGPINTEQYKIREITGRVGVIYDSLDLI